MSIMLFVNLKGGVAKTTNAVAVAECLADSGRKVLLIDADHQSMAGELLLGEKRLLRCERRKKTLHDLLIAMLGDEFEAENVDYFIERKTSNIGGGIDSLSVLPCSIRIDDFQTNYAKARGGYRSNEEFHRALGTRNRVVRRWLKNNFDIVIVDCPPSLALQVQVLLKVADSFIIPAIPDCLSVRGSHYLLDRLRRSNYRIAGLGTLWSLFRKQNRMHRDTLEAAARREERFQELPTPFETIIPNAAAIAESTKLGGDSTSFTQKYTPQFARLYRRLCAEILLRSEQHDAKRNDQLELVASGCST